MIFEGHHNHHQVRNDFMPSLWGWSVRRIRLHQFFSSHNLYLLEKGVCKKQCSRSHKSTTGIISAYMLNSQRSFVWRWIRSFHIWGCFRAYPLGIIRCNSYGCWLQSMCPTTLWIRCIITLWVEGKFIVTITEECMEQVGINLSCEYRMFACIAWRLLIWWQLQLHCLVHFFNSSLWYKGKPCLMNNFLSFGILWNCWDLWLSGFE